MQLRLIAGRWARQHETARVNSVVMKNTHQCPKCQSQDIIHVPNLDFHHIPISMFKMVSIARYICASCGFCEEWIDSPEDRQKLKDYYQSE